MNPYDLTIIGGGSAGLVLAVAGAKLGKKTALVEKHRLGGDCLWTGCVPSKAILKSAKIAHYMKDAERYGIMVKDFQVDFQRVMQHVRGAQHTIESEHDNPERFREMGVDVIFGNGHFESPTTFVVEDVEKGQTTILKSKKFVISTGSRPVAPPIPGLESIRYLDSEN
ncbi:FAD-dependent oxidoreductase, partial [Candidatus Poribacteria bacterium]|nr:FAD-dependent oxidoreductase [Candidatus Poribacteria bacterium]